MRANFCSVTARPDAQLVLLNNWMKEQTRQERLGLCYIDPLGSSTAFSQLILRLHLLSISPSWSLKLSTPGAFHVFPLFLAFSSSGSFLESLTIEKSQYVWRSPGLPVPSLLPDLCSECLGSASHKSRLTLSSLMIITDEIFLCRFWLFQLYQLILVFCEQLCQMSAPHVSPLSSKKWNLSQSEAFPNIWTLIISGDSG